MIDFRYRLVYFLYMRPTHRIESFLGSRSRISVLRALISTDTPLNASQIAAMTNLTRPAVTTVLQDFAGMGLVRSSSAGRANVHLLNRKNVYVQHLVIPLFSAENALPEWLEDDLRAAFGECAESIVLFGSYARGDQDAHSDIDVVLVADDATCKQAIDRQLDSVGREFRARYGAALSALTYEASDANALWRTAPAFLESLKRDGLVVHGRGPWEWNDDE